MAKEIVSVSLGPSSRDFAFHTEMFGEEIQVQRYGADGDVHRARDWSPSLTVRWMPSAWVR